MDKVFRVTAGLACLFCMITSGAMLWGLDSQIFLHRAWVVEVAPQESSGTDLLAADAVQSFSRRSGAGVVRIHPDPADPDTARTFSVEAGEIDALQSWLRHGYPCFACDTATRVVPYAAAAPSSSGPYLVVGERPDADRLRQQLTDIGLRSDPPYPVGDLSLGLAVFVGSPVFFPFCAAGLAVLLILGANIALRGKEWGIRRLAGESWASRFGCEVVWSARWWMIATAGALALSALVLLPLNRLHHFSVFATVSLVLTGVIVLLGVAVTAVSLWLASRSSITESVKGRLSGNAWLAGAMGGRLLAALLLTFVSLAAAHAQVGYRQAQDLGRLLAPVGEYQLLTRSSAADIDAQHSLAKWVQDVAGRPGGLLLAHRAVISQAPSTDHHDAYPPVPSLGREAVLQLVIVNPAYVDTVEITTPEGRRLRAAEVNDGTPQLLVPQHRVAEAGSMISMVTSYLSELSSDAGQDPSAAPIRTRTMADDVHVVAFDNGAPAMVSDGALVLVVALDGRQVPVMALQSWANDVVVDPQALSENRLPGAVADALYSHVSLDTVLAQARRDGRLALVGQTVGALLALLVLVGCCFAQGYLYIRRNVQRLFVQRCSGRGALERFGPLIMLELAVLGIGSAWSVTSAMAEPDLSPFGQPQDRFWTWQLWLGPAWLTTATILLAAALAVIGDRLLARAPDEV